MVLTTDTFAVSPQIQFQEMYWVGKGEPDSGVALGKACLAQSCVSSSHTTGWAPGLRVATCQVWSIYSLKPGHALACFPNSRSSLKGGGSGGGSWPLANPTTCLAQWVRIRPSSNAGTPRRCCGLDSRPHSETTVTIKHVTWLFLFSQSI